MKKKILAEIDEMIRQFDGKIRFAFDKEETREIYRPQIESLEHLKSFIKKLK